MHNDRQLRSLKIVFVLLLMAIGLTFWFDYKQSHARAGIDFGFISTQIGKWTGTDMAKADEDQDRAARGDLIIRLYAEGGNRIYLVAIQERGDRHRVHPPVNCYTGSGWRILTHEDLLLGDNGEKMVKKLYVTRGQTSRIVYYWFTNGKKRCAGFLGHLFLYARDILLSRTADSWVYFDVSADVTDNPKTTEAMISAFIKELDQLPLFAQLNQTGS